MQGRASYGTERAAGAEQRRPSRPRGVDSPSGGGGYGRCPGGAPSGGRSGGVCGGRGVAAVGAGMGPDLGLSGPWPLLALAGISIVAMNNVQCAKYN
jgi:hypothetical protein